jgi:TfoX N-terminal domain
MSFDAGLAQRMRELLCHEPVTERRMFGGIAFMSRNYMFAGVNGHTLMARVGPAWYAEALSMPHVREMDFTGRPMKGYVFVDAPGIGEDEALRFWLDRCLSFVRTLPDK